jgi:hypothetical protein
LSAGGGGSVGVLLNQAKVINGLGFGVRARAGVTINAARVAGFTALGGPADPTSFRAKINWGDGTPASDGTVVAALTSSGGVFQVLGRHKYARRGRYLITVDIVWPAAGVGTRVVGAAIVS